MTILSSCGNNEPSHANVRAIALVSLAFPGHNVQQEIGDSAEEVLVVVSHFYPGVLLF